MILAERRPDLSRFPDADHLAAWAVTHTNTFLAALSKRWVRRLEKPGYRVTVQPAASDDTDSLPNTG